MTTMSAPFFSAARIAGFLIAAVSTVLRVHNRVNTKAMCKLNGIILRCIVNKQHLIHDIHGNFTVGSFQSSCCVVGWKDDDYFVVVEHENTCNDFLDNITCQLVDERLNLLGIGRADAVMRSAWMLNHMVCLASSMKLLILLVSLHPGEDSTPLETSTP